MPADKIQVQNPNVDLTAALLWQENNAPNITKLVQLKNAWYQTNHVVFWQNWFINTFDIRTCDQFGLMVWSIILDIPLTISQSPSNPNKPTFGFGSYNKNFDNGNFTTIQQTVIVLTIDDQRDLLLLRYNQLTGNCRIPWINRMLKRILGDYGPIYALDPLDMSAIVYVVDFIPSAGLVFILANCNVLPSPAGVPVKVLLKKLTPFGFGAFNQNFYNANFINQFLVGA
jgi:hypothetical protein